MLPALKEGQDVISFNWFYKSKIGDIVVIKQGDKEMVKRVTKIDGRQILVKGDNRQESTDSRDFGPVRMEQVVGKVIYPSASLGASQVPCPQCNSPVIGIYGRKDAICKNCGFKLTCCE